MTEAKEPHQLEAEGKRAYQAKRYGEAARLFAEASRGYTLGRDGLHAAEMDNNRSVALLKDNRPQEAFDAADGTDKVFEGANDALKQGMALGNQAAALDALKRYAEAIERYQRASALFETARSKDMRAMVQKEIAAIRLKQGKINEAGLEMIDSITTVENEKPTLWQRFLKFLLRFRQ